MLKTGVPNARVQAAIVGAMQVQIAPQASEATKQVVCDYYLVWKEFKRYIFKIHHVERQGENKKAVAILSTADKKILKLYTMCVLEESNYGILEVEMCYKKECERFGIVHKNIVCEALEPKCIFLSLLHWARPQSKGLSKNF